MAIRQLSKSLPKIRLYSSSLDVNKNLEFDYVFYERSLPFLREMKMAWARPGILCMRAALQKAFQTSKTQKPHKNILKVHIP